MVPVKQTGLDSILLPDHKKSNYLPGSPASGLRLGHNRKQVFITTDRPRGRSSRAHTFLMNRIVAFPSHHKQ